MKAFNKMVVLALLGSLLIIPGCKKVLVEKNRSNITPEFFATAGGLDAGVIAAYSIIRWIYTTEAGVYHTSIGTDDAVRGFGTSSNLSTYTIQTNEGATASLWNNAYQAINNCNGVLEFGTTSPVSAADKQRLMAEAKFLRAWWYFELVRSFGAVTVNTKFVTEPSTSAVRDPLSVAYDLIVQDLTEASAELPDKANPTPGRAAKGAALHLLAKVYLTRGWSDAAKASDFTDAYNTAKKLIDNKTTYGNGNGGTVDLWQDYADIFKEGNEYGREVLWVIDRNTNPTGSEQVYGTGGPANKYNGAAFYHRPNYPTLSINVNQGITGAPAVVVNPIDRDIANGRPFGRVRPSDYTLNVAFAERVNDSRYEKTFQTFYIFNRPGPLSAPTPVNIDVTRAADFADPMGALTTYRWVKGVDTSVKLIGRNNVTEAERRTTKAVILTPSQYDVNIFPPMKKHDDASKLHTNDASDRPFIMMRFGETYLIAAEAAWKASRNADAADMINVLRTRAAYRATNTPAENAAAAAALQVSPGDVNLDLLMDERTRELYGEWMRWYDLVRTKSLADRLARYNPIANFSATRDILRPIPQESQLNLVTTGPAYPQNPGY
jgi:hypothetical protein